jgi:hypothetical protein
MIEIADGVVDENNPIPEDVARSKLKIDTRRFLITVNNRPPSIMSTYVLSVK